LALTAPRYLPGLDVMGLRLTLRAAVRVFIPFLFTFSLLSGCQSANLPSAGQLIEHRDSIDASDLLPCSEVEQLNVSLALPNGWKALGVQKNPLYAHQQWRSPSKRTAVGVTFIHMPLPLSTKTLVWFAMQEAGKQTQGKIIRQWKDDLGREWFEAENVKYHMTGYVMTRGFDAWINYCGYRVQEEKMPQEMEVGGKSLDTIVPLNLVRDDEMARGGKDKGKLEPSASAQ
jgi:hypothetical protein